jgi:flagellar basal-body rod protein FlgF
MNLAVYAAYLGMRARQQRLDVIANNIANASTTGFKAHRVNYRSVVGAETENPAASANNPTASQSTAGQSTASQSTDRARQLRNGSELGVLTTESIDFSPGPIRETGRSLDVALDGDGFLVVQTARGQRYTRQGSLTLDNAGQLVTQNGDLIVGDSGPITVPPGQVNIGDDGTIASDGQVAGKLKLVRFADPNAALIREGNSLFASTGDAGAEATGTRVIQSSLEMSNVSSLTEMVAMMQNTREFESLQKSVSTIMNDLGRKVANELGRI